MYSRVYSQGRALNELFATTRVLAHEVEYRYGFVLVAQTQVHVYSLSSRANGDGYKAEMRRVGF
jgi:hypothetical protein